MLRTVHQLPVKILQQPDETTCGPTCLQAIYDYWGKPEALENIIARTRKLESGSGTFDVFLACDALSKGFQATIYTYNLMVFDPSWFAAGVDIAARLKQQQKAKSDRRLNYVTEGYLEFLKLGGRIRLVDLSHALIHGLLRRGLPILTGLSSTFLYRVAREYGPNDTPDDIRGEPAGHFVIIARYYEPYRKRVERAIVEAIGCGNNIIHIASHSFTAVLKGQERLADVGLLYDPSRLGERQLCCYWQSKLKECLPELTIRRNYPYLGKADGFTSYLRRQFPADRYLGIELEINQKHVARGGGHWQQLRQRLISAMSMLP